MRGTEIAAAWLLTYLLHSTLLLGAVWALTRWRVRAHASRELLWKVALLGGLLSASVQVAAGYQPLAGRLSVAPRPAASSAATKDVEGREESGVTATDAATAAAAAIEKAADGGVQPGANAASGPRSTADSAASAGAPTTPKPRRASPVVLAIVAAWALVAFLLALRFLVAHLLLLVRIGPRALVRDAQLVELVDLLREEAGLRRPVRLSRAAGLPSPIALGRSEICLPEAAIAELDREQQESMLAHEVAHLARRDPAWLVIGSLVERLLFVQPLNVLARRRIQEAAEYQCDDWAARRTGSGLTLAQCLLKVAEWIDATAEPVPLAGMSEVRSHFVERVDRLVAGRGLASRPPSRWLAPTAAAAVLAVAVAAPAVTATADDFPSPTLLAHAWYLSPLAADAEGGSGGSLQPAPVASAAGAGPALIGALDDAEPEVRAAAAEALGKRREGAAVPALIRALRDGETAVRASAVEALAEIGDARALDGLLAALADESPAVKAKAADAVGELAQDTGTAQRSAQALAALLGDASVEVRREAVQALSELETARPLAALTTALADADAEVRRTAAGAIGELGARQAAAKLVPLLADPDAEVRHAAAESLGELGDPTTAPALARALTDRHPDVRQAAAASLAELGLTQAPPELLAALRDEHPDVRHAAAHAVGEMQDPRAVPSLVALVGDADADVREAAVDSLGEIHDAAAIDALVRAMKANDPNVRKRAADALGERN